MAFIFDGVSSRKMHLATKYKTENRIPDLRNNTSKIAGRNGVFDFGETISERVIEIQCYIPPRTTPEELLQIKDDLITWLNPEKGLRKLMIDREPGRYYMARLKSGVSIEKGIRNSGSFTLSFFCPDPYAYASPDETGTFTTGGSFYRSLGNMVSHPLYEVRGALKNQTEYLSFLINGEEVKIHGVLGATETFFLDTETMTAYIKKSNGITRNALSCLDALNFPYLDMGMNSVRIGDCTGRFDSLVITARSRWL